MVCFCLSSLVKLWLPPSGGCQVSQSSSPEMIPEIWRCEWLNRSHFPCFRPNDETIDIENARHVCVHHISIIRGHSAAATLMRVERRRRQRRQKYHFGIHFHGHVRHDRRREVVSAQNHTFFTMRASWYTIGFLPGTCLSFHFYCHG
jgi:hypothetical protein